MFIFSPAANSCHIPPEAGSKVAQVWCEWLVAFSNAKIVISHDFYLGNLTKHQDNSMI